VSLIDTTADGIYELNVYYCKKGFSNQPTFFPLLNMDMKTARQSLALSKCPFLEGVQIFLVYAMLWKPNQSHFLFPIVNPRKKKGILE
jgi:hypothetical protein